MDTKECIDTVMIFTAGYGKRMKHLTANQPKTLVKISGKPILGHILESIINTKINKIIINTHYCHEQINSYIKAFQNDFKPNQEFIIIYEQKILETGGAIKNALSQVTNKSIFVCNSDTIIRSPFCIFEYLNTKWNIVQNFNKDVDYLLLLQPKSETIGYVGNGDFNMSVNGAMKKPHNIDHFDYIYTGICILKPQAIAKRNEQIFSLGKCFMDNLSKIRGTSIQGLKWYHASMPNDIQSIEDELN